MGSQGLRPQALSLSLLPTEHETHGESVTRAEALTALRQTSADLCFTFTAIPRDLPVRGIADTWQISIWQMTIDDYSHSGFRHVLHHHGRVLMMNSPLWLA